MENERASLFGKVSRSPRRASFVRFQKVPQINTKKMLFIFQTLRIYLKFHCVSLCSLISGVIANFCRWWCWVCGQWSYDEWWGANSADDDGEGKHDLHRGSPGTGRMLCIPEKLNFRLSSCCVTLTLWGKKHTRNYKKVLSYCRKLCIQVRLHHKKKVLAWFNLSYADIWSN